MAEPTQWAVEIAKKCGASNRLMAVALDAARQQGYREGRDAGAKLADERAAGSVTSISFGENFDGSRSDILALVNQISASRIATLAEDIRALTPEDNNV